MADKTKKKTKKPHQIQQPDLRSIKKEDMTERKHTKGSFQKIKTSAMDGIKTCANPGPFGSTNFI